MTDQTRAETVAEGRRKRDSIAATDPSLRRFGVDMSILDDNYTYRSVADESNRLYELTDLDDYDFVTIKGEAARKADGAGVLRYQHTVLDGKPRYTYLLRKLKKHDEEDRSKKLRKVDEEEKQRLKDATPDSDLKGEQTYKPRASKD